MAGRPGRRAALAAAGIDLARLRVCQARASELAEGVNTAVRRDRLRAIHAAMVEGVWVQGKSARWFADAWGMRRRTVESDAHIALGGLKATTDDELGSLAAAHVVDALEKDAELADRLSKRVSEAIAREPAKALAETAGAYRSVASERNRAAELLARISGRLTNGPAVAVHVDARGVNVDAYPANERALLERAKAGDEEADRLARLLLASGSTTLDELRDWLAPAVRALFEVVVDVEVSDG
jgi:hypothetical protein